MSSRLAGVVSREYSVVVFIDCQLWFRPRTVFEPVLMQVLCRLPSLLCTKMHYVGLLWNALRLNLMMVLLGDILSVPLTFRLVSSDGTPRVIVGRPLRRRPIPLLSE